jgi:hypothetical protein
MKLVGFQLPLELRQHFRQELDTWLDKIHRLLMKPNDRTGRSKFYFDLLFEFPKEPKRRHHRQTSPNGCGISYCPAARLSAGKTTLDLIPE